MKTHPNTLLLLAMLPLLAWSGWHPYDRITWWLEVSPVFAGFVALFIAQANGWRLSHFALVLIGLHMIVLMVGGKNAVGSASSPSASAWRSARSMS